MDNDDDYGSSDAEDHSSEIFRMKEVIEELQQQLNNITENQLETPFKDKIAKLISDVANIKKRFPEDTNHSQIKDKHQEIESEIIKHKGVLDKTTVSINQSI